MSRATDKVEVAQRLLTELIALVPVFTSRIYLTSDGRPPEHAIRDSELLTVQIAGGQFDYGRQVGAGNLGVAYQGTAVVRLWCRNESDEHGDDQHLLLSEPFGLFRVQHALLKLADSCLSGLAGDDPILESGIKILSDDAPERGFPEEAFGGSAGGGWGRGMLAITYDLDFVWDLSRATDAALTTVP